MNLILWVEGSSAAIPFGTLVAILALWFGISVPLTFAGAYFGFKKPVSVSINRCSSIAIQIVITGIQKGSKKLDLLIQDFRSYIYE